MGMATKRRHPLSSAADDVLIEKLGAKGFQLLVRRLTATQRAFETLADVAPELLIQFRGNTDWQHRVPADMIELFQALLDRFDKANLNTTPAVDRKLLLTLVKGAADCEEAT